jgi:hypothetical protein
MACLLLLIGLQSGILPHKLLADSVALHPVADTTLFAIFPTNNLGASTQLVAGGNAHGSPRRALIRFDISNQISSNAAIQSVALTVNVTTVPPGGGVGSVFELHRLLVDWKEGRGIGNFGQGALAGETTWNTRFYAATLWDQPGAAVQSEFSETASASLFVGGLGSFTFASTSNLVADVQQWLVNPQTNFGWLLLSQSETSFSTVRRFASREDTPNAPSLAILYAVPAPLVIDSFQVTNGVFQLSFEALAGQAYTVEHSQSLGSGTWSTLTNLPVQSISTNVLIADPIGEKRQRCYRIAIRLEIPGYW